VDELAAALAFDRAVRVRGARRTIELPEGVVLLHDRLPTLHHLNAVMLDAPLPYSLDAAAIARLADGCLGHLTHRYVVLDDPAAGARVAGELREAGWTIERIVFMSLRRAADRPPRQGVAREVQTGEIRAVELQMSREEWPYGDDSLPARVVAGMDALRTGTSARCFAAGENGELSAACTLFIDGGAALLDNVGTLTACRRRGLGRAVIAAAIDAARASGCNPILVPADADDWPQRLYARMGFEPLGIQLSCTLTAGPAR
jgi:GNAT superfamily N-acetyltransferase